MLKERNIAVYFEDEKIEKNVVFVDKYTGSGYGTNNIEIEQTIKDMLFTHGIPLDSTYTGKAYTGMKAYLIEQGVRGKNILFIHTGGTPLFFDELENIN